MKPLFAACGALLLWLLGTGAGFAQQAVLATQARPVALPTAATPAQSPQPFSVSGPQDLVVTVTDLQFPSALKSATAAVVQGGTVVASATLAPPSGASGSTPPPAVATLSLPQANGSYSIIVFGVPDPSTGAGSFTACVAPSASPTSCITADSFSGNLAVPPTLDPTVSTYSVPLTITQGGAYTVSFADLKFPVALAPPSAGGTTNPTLAIFQGVTAVALGIASGASVTLAPGSYQLLAVAQADATAKAGLFSVALTGPTGTTSPLAQVFPVGQLAPAARVINPAAQALTLAVTDYAFPGTLASAEATLTVGASVLATAAAGGGAVNAPNAPAGALSLWTYAAPGATAGTFSADVSSASSDLYTVAQGVDQVGSTSAYAFVTPNPVAAGSYQVTAADLQFPAQLAGLSFAVAQNGTLLAPPGKAGMVNVTAAAGRLVLLASAQPPVSGGVTGSGLFDVSVQSGGATPQLVFDQTQAVSNAGVLFDAQSLTLGTAGAFSATLSDLQVPAPFGTLALVVSQGPQILGKIFGGGSFPFNASPGTYQLTFVASPAAGQQFGLYAAGVTFAPPAITLTASATSVVDGSPVALTWSVTGASGCTAGGGAWSGDKNPVSGTDSVVLSGTTTYTLTCTGNGGSSKQSVTVTALPKPAGGGGGGALDVTSLAALATLVFMARGRRNPSASGRRG